MSTNTKNMLAYGLSLTRTNSTAHMSRAEREAGIEVMLSDLHRLAAEDGCIAAGWALEMIEVLWTGRPDADELIERHEAHQRNREWLRSQGREETDHE